MTDQTKKSIPTVLLILSFVTLALLGIRTISLSEVWTHLATGRVIAEQGMPTVDTLSYTVEGAAWTVPTWLYDRIGYTIYSIGGAGLFTLVHVALVLGAFAMLLPVSRKWAHVLSVATALLLSSWLIAPSFSPSPALVGLLFSALFVSVLTSGSKKAWMPWAALVPAQILWANMDTSFFAGIFISAVFAVEAAIASRTDPEKMSLAKKLGLLTIVCAVVSMLNPKGPGLYLYLMRTWADPSFLFTRDWISPFSGMFTSQFSKNVITLSLVLGALGLVAQKKKLPIALTSLAVMGAFLVVRAPHRHLALYALIAFPFFCLSISAVGEYVGNFLKGINERAVEPTTTAMGGILSLILIVSMLAVVSNAYYVSSGSVSTFGLGHSTALCPKDVLKTVQSDGFTEKLMHLPGDGAYLTWAAPGRKVFVDQRPQVYTAEFYRELYNGLLSGNGDVLKALLEKYEPEAILLNNTLRGAGPAVARLLSSGQWRLTYFDGVSSLMLHVSQPDPENVESLRQAGLASLTAAAEVYRSKLGGFASPGVSPRLLGAGAIYLALNEFEKAAAAYQLVIHGSPNCAVAWHNLGVSELQIERNEDAVEHLEKASKLQPNNPLTWLWLSKAYADAEYPKAAEVALERARNLDSRLTASFTGADVEKSEK